MKKPGMLAGALVGAFLTAPLIALFYLGYAFAGLPFAPFDVFDWMARVLPGPVITFGIDTISGVIRALDLGATSEVAKMAEQALAVIGLFVTGVVLGMVLFARLRRAGRRGYGTGMLVGLIVGAAVLAISLSVNQNATAGLVFTTAWIVLLFVVWGAMHVWAFRRLDQPAETVGVEVVRLDRRRFLVRLGGAAAVVTVAGAGLGALVGVTRRKTTPRATRWSDDHPLPNAGAQVPPVEGTRPELTSLEDHYRIDINTRSPRVDEATWRLKIDGLVDEPATWTLDELREAFAPMDQFITLECISNPIAGDLISTQRWTGVSVQQVLDRVRPKAQATHLKVSSVDGFFEVVPIDTIHDDERVMLAYAWDGVPLPVSHGFPLRIYVPNKYGMKQPKWIEHIEAIDAWEPGYWVRRGWDRDAEVQITSVIDTVRSNMMVGDDAAQTVLPIGGIAYAGARGISKVEVRVDDGPWQEAQLRDPLSETTWVLWRYDWTFAPGDHHFVVRCYDAAGNPQIAERTSVRPDGATGLHSINRML